MMKGFITSVMKGFITSSQLVDSGAVMVKSAFPGERPHRRRSALGVMGAGAPARFVGPS
jgi:hypothetical protein